jgi:hypothetical protein
MMATRNQVKPSGKTWQPRSPDGTRPMQRQPQPTFRSVYRKDARAFR